MWYVKDDLGFVFVANQYLGRHMVRLMVPKSSLRRKCFPTICPDISSCKLINCTRRFENTYPGVRCDIPAHVYQSGFAPNTQWTEEFAQGAEIRDYWQGVARKYNVYHYLRLKQQVQQAEWLAEEGKWKVTIQHVDGSNKVSNIRIPQLEGLCLIFALLF